MPADAARDDAGDAGAGDAGAGDGAAPDASDAFFFQDASFPDGEAGVDPDAGSLSGDGAVPDGELADAQSC